MKPMSRLLAFLVLAGPASAAEPHAYRAAKLMTGDGKTFTDAVLVVRDGKVVAAGKFADVNVPADAVVHELGDVTIIPGLIAAETSLAEKGRDDLHALTPHHRAVDGFDPYADYSTALSGGVTTAQVAPGRGRLMPGQGGVVKLFGDDPAKRMLREEESLRVVLGEASKNPPRIYEPPVGAVSVDRPLEATRPQLGAGLGGAMAGVRASFKAARAQKDSRDPYLRAVAGSGTDRKPLRVTATTAADLQAALTLAKEFDLRLILVEPPVVKDKLADWKPHVVGVVLGPGVRPGTTADGDAPAHPPAEAARDLRAAGFRVAVKPVNDADLKDMLYLGGVFTSHATADEALKMLTADAAELLGVADRVGTLAAGKDADFVVLGGDPFALHTRVKAVYVDGQQAYEAKPAAARKVVRAGKVLTGTGEIIDGGAVLVDGPTIRAVGRDVSTPADAEEKRYANAVIVPGFIDLGNGLGFGGPITSPAAMGSKVGDRLVSDPGAKTVRQGGVTTVLLSSTGSPGPVLAFKLGDKPRVVKEPAAIRFAVRGNLTSTGANLRDVLRTGKAYADGWAKYEAELPAYEIKKKEYDAAVAKAAAEKKPEEKKDDKKDEKKDDKKPEEKKLEAPKAPEKPQTIESMEPYRALFAGKMPALVEAKREDAIRLAVTIFRDGYNLRTVLVGPDDAHRLADLLAAKSVSVVAGPELIHSADREDVNLPLSVAVRGIPLGFQSHATTGARNLPAAVGYAVRLGLGADEALHGLTSGPAKMLGVDGIGTLAVGKDADLVVLSGMPFEPSTRVLAVMIDGVWVYREAE
jgi:imidazolonepropionase-like amidohydrolase